MVSNTVRVGTVEMSAAMIISGTIGWLVVVSGQSAFNVVFFRCLFGAAALLAVCLWRELIHRGMLSTRVIALVLAGGAAIVLNWVLLFAAYPRASISVATTVYNTQPFMLIALGALVFREKITGPTFGWLALSFAGLVLVVEHQPAVLVLQGRYLEGIGLAVGAAFLYTIASLIAKGLKGTSPHVIALLQVTLGVVLLAPFTDFHALPASASQWGSLVTLGLVHTCLMYVLLYGAIQKLPTAMTGALSFIYPVVAIIVDHFALGQHLAWSQLAGAALILLAAAGVNQGWTFPLLRPRTGKPG